MFQCESKFSCGVLSGVSVIYITPISATFIRYIRIVYEEYSAFTVWNPITELELIKKI